MAHGPKVGYIAEFDLSSKAGDAGRKALLDSSLDCIIWTDAQGRIHEFNAAAERTFRMPRAAALGKEVSEAILPLELRPHLRNEFLASATSGGVELVGNRLETKAMRADGTEFPAEVTVSTALIQNQTTLIIYVRDISARQRAEEALVRLAAIVESSHDAIIGTDFKCRITSWNKAAELMYGYTAVEAIGQDISIIAPPDRIQEGIRIRDESNAGRKVKSFETLRIAKDGRRLNVSLGVSPVRDSDGVVVGASAIERDITAQKQAQDALQKANETSIYASPVPIIAVGTDGRVTMWNPAAQAVFGWNELEVIGKENPVTLAGTTDEDSALLKRALAGETLTGIEVHGAKRDGSFVAISLSTTSLRDSHQKIRGTIGFLTDITESKRAEEVLRRTEQKYRDIFENALDGIYQTTPQGRYLSANPALARIFGFSNPEELVKVRTDVRNHQYVNPEMHEEFVSLMRTQGMVQNFEYQAYREDGKTIWVSENAHVVRDAKGKIVHFEGTVHDVTEQRELEQQLRQMHKIEAVGRLAGGVAHDFNNVLMAISSYTELLQRKSPDNGPTRKYLDEIEKAVDRAASLTQGLLAFSRKQVLSPRILDLNSLINDQIHMLTRLIPENIELKFIPDKDLGQTKVDAGGVGQVVMNLVINARDAMSDGGRISIETYNSELSSGAVLPTEDQPVGSYVVVAVSDNGCGMDEITKSQMFEPFFTTKELGKGTGLGLAIVFGIVKQSGGQIFVRSEPGVGTTFKIYFPRVDGSIQTDSDDGGLSTCQATETILLVEDEEGVRESTAEYLTQTGYTVLKANDGPQALALATAFTQRIDLLLTDVVMPKMSGRDLSEKIKVVHPEAAVVFMSGYSNNLLSDQQILDPRHVLLQKPIRLPMLGKAIREILDREQD